MKQIELYQSPVRFDAEAHRYFLEEQELHGITSTLIKRAFPNKYSDVDEETLARAAEKGKQLHELIELHDSLGVEVDDIRVKNYADWKQANGYTTIATEYLVSDEENYASSIDLVLQDADGKVVLADVKTTYKLDRDSTALQLSIYKLFFEKSNKGIKVDKILAIWLPNKDHSVLEAVELPLVDEQTIWDLILADLNDAPFEFGTPEELLKEISIYNDLQIQINLLQQQAETLKAKVQDYMEQHGRSTMKTDFYTITYIPSKTSKKFNSTKFKLENNDIYTSYMEETITKPQIRFTPIKN